MIANLARSLCHSEFIQGKFYYLSQKILENFNFYKINIPNHYPEQKIWISCLLFWAGNLNCLLPKVIWNIYFGEVKILQTQVFIFILFMKFAKLTKMALKSDFSTSKLWLLKLCGLLWLLSLYCKMTLSFLSSYQKILWIISSFYAKFYLILHFWGWNSTTDITILGNIYGCFWTIKRGR
jgi:hypothetical protein